MAIDADIKAIQACIHNRLEPSKIANRRVAAVIGDAPSQYSKSPALWNAAFQRLGIGAIYLPFDVPEGRLKEFASATRNCQRMLGFNVTVPHKQKIMDYLDELDGGAARIHAVNTVVRMNTGRLIGYNTDGEGFLDSILKPQPGATRSFIESLENLDVLILGAGGAARAVGFYVADLLNGGELIICNRTMESAVSLAAEIRKRHGNARAIPETDLRIAAPKVGLIINSTTKGQGGMRKLPGAKITTLEPYSSLAPAEPVAVAVAGEDEPAAERRWADVNRSEIRSNNQASLELAESIPRIAAFYDLIYHPEETVFLRHARETGHRTMNGKAMIVNQAVIGFCKRVCSAELRTRGIDNPETYRQVLAVMYRAW